MIRIILLALTVAIGIIIYIVHARTGDHNLLGATTDVGGWHTLGNFRMPAMASENGALRIGTNPMGPDALPVVLFRSDAVITDGQRYVISFDGKAEPARHMELVAENDNIRHPGPSIKLGLQVDVSLTADWQHFDYTFTGKNADHDNDRVPRIQFVASDAGGSVWLKNMRLDRVD